MALNLVVSGQGSRCSGTELSRLLQRGGRRPWQQRPPARWLHNRTRQRCWNNNTLSLPRRAAGSEAAIGNLGLWFGLVIGLPYIQNAPFPRRYIHRVWSLLLWNGTRLRRGNSGGSRRYKCSGCEFCRTDILKGQSSVDIARRSTIDIRPAADGRTDFSVIDLGLVGNRVSASETSFDTASGHGHPIYLGMAGTTSSVNETNAVP
mmetsp:Transcript_73789/g.158292  ORF Transcript_73789/g.158292 Transcript_73789/m.158292 type:complete len:205 (+) Transcript_73789:270-884(+)